MSALPSGDDASTLEAAAPGNHSFRRAVTREVPHSAQSFALRTVRLATTISLCSQYASGVPGLAQRDSFPKTLQSARVKHAIAGLWLPALALSLAVFSRAMENTTSIPRRSNAPAIHKTMASLLLFCWGISCFG